MARLEKIGAFALTEPQHGSDSVALETTARRDGDEYVIDGAKRWIGNGTIADVVIVWARSLEDGQVKGFLVETDTPGYAASVIEGKGCCARGLAGQHPARGGAGPGLESPARANQLQGHRPRAREHARDVRLGRAGPRRRPPTTQRSRTPSSASSSAGRCAASRSSRTGS